MPVGSVQYITLVKNPDMEQNPMTVVTDNTIIFRGRYFLKHMLCNHPGCGVLHVFLRKITEFRQLYPFPFLKNAPDQPSVYLSLGNAVLSISQKDATNVACSVVIFASVTVRRNDCIRL